MKRLNLILLVDDDETTNFLNKRLLTRMQIAERIEVVTNGEEALRFLTDSFANEQPLPDLMFLDIKMPVMDGFSFLDEYHALNLAQDGSMIILMLTSSASFYDLEKLKGYTSVKKHFSKALTENDIKEIMADYYQKS